MTTSVAPVPSKSRVLYVRTSGCVGSQVCLRVLEAHASVAAQVDVEYLEDLLRGDTRLPIWLDGSPILVNTRKREPPLYGTQARDALMDMRKGRGTGSPSTPTFVSTEEEGASGGFWGDTDSGMGGDTAGYYPDPDVEQPKLDDAALKEAIAQRNAQVNAQVNTQVNVAEGGHFGSDHEHPHPSNMQS